MYPSYLRKRLRFFVSSALIFLSASWAVFLLSGCAAPPNIQPRINALVASQWFDTAAHILTTKKDDYGAQNELLYLLDKAYVLHLTGRYEESIRYFEASKRKFDELYTKSLSNIAATWIINDNRAPYRGEDFEPVLVNIFQALNFAALGDFNEGLIEARDVDGKLNLINRLYADHPKNVYREDAFARLLMGILYEASGNRQDVNDAFISYKKALEIYEKDYQKNYELGAPGLLIENILAVSQYLGFEELGYTLDCPTPNI